MKSDKQDYVSKLGLYGKITQKHADEINEFIQSELDRQKKEILYEFENWRDSQDDFVNWKEFNNLLKGEQV